MQTTSLFSANVLNAAYIAANPYQNSPVGLANLGKIASEKGEHFIAASWYRRARGATIGHTRAEIYREAEKQQFNLGCKILIKENETKSL